MNKSFKLIYLGILKFGFKDSKDVSIVGLLDFISQKNLIFDEDPIIRLNSDYVSKAIDDWFWEIEMKCPSKCGNRFLVVYFNDIGCNYSRFEDRHDTCTRFDGRIEKYEDFLKQYNWLVGSE